MSETTRADKVERHFRNSVRGAILDLMEVMDPGEKLRWGSLSYKELLSAAKNRLDAELLHETEVAAESTALVPGTWTETRSFICVECGAKEETLQSWTLGGKYPLCEKCARRDENSGTQTTAEVPESSVEMTVEASEPVESPHALALPKETRLK